MGYVSVKFLGEEYQVPETINEFLRYDQLLSPIMKKSLSMLSRDIEDDATRRWVGDMSHVLDTTERYISLVNEGIDLLVKKLVAMDIYDVTAKDLLRDVTAIDEITRARDATLRSILSESQKVLELKNTGRMNAYRYAASNITGSGVRIFTSSFAMLMLHSAVEKSILLSQAKKADQEYENALKKINSQAGDALDRACRSVMLHQFYPSIMQALLKYMNQAMSFFLVEATMHDKFDFDSVKDYNMQKAADIIKNVNWASDKAAALKKAFLTCPFAQEVYEACLDNGLMDQGTFETATYFGMGPVIAEKMELYIKNNSSNVNLIRPIVHILAVYKGKDEKFYWETAYYHIVRDVLENYRKYNEALSDKKKLDKYIRGNISSQMLELVEQSEQKIRILVNKEFTNMIREEEYRNFVDLGILSPESVRPEKSSATSLSEINDEIKGALVAAIMEYIKEAQRRLAIYDEAKSAFDDAVKIKQDEIDALKADKEKLGFWAFSKKRQLDEVMGQKLKELTEFKRDNEPKDLLRSFERMYS